MAIGAVLDQEEAKKPYAIYYISKNLTPTELNYTMTKDTIIHFLFQIFMRYGFPREIIMEGGPQFLGHNIAATLKKYHILHRVTSPYHP